MSTFEEIVRSAPPAHRPATDAGSRRSRRVLRPSRTALGALVALMMLLAGGLAAADAARVIFLGAAPRLLPLAELSRLTWSERPVLLAAGVLVLAGAALVGAAVIPGRVRLIPLQSDDPLLVIGVTRRGLRRCLVSACEVVPGVDRVQVRLRRDFIEVIVVTSSPWTGGIVPGVRAAVQDQLAAARVIYDHHVAVRLMRANL